MSYITSKSISVNYVRAVFRFRKSDQFTLLLLLLITRNHHLRVFDYVTDLKARKPIYHQQIVFAKYRLTMNLLS